MIAPAPTVPPHVRVLSSVTTVVFEEEWYEATSPEHFWMEWRFRAFRRQLRDLRIDLDALGAALDVGGGHGVLRRQVEGATCWAVDLAEINLAALARCPPGRGQTLYYDILDCHPALLERYDALFLFDVLEHIEAPRPFLAASVAHLRPGGRLFVNVPALPSLYSGYDTVLGHFRRYRPVSLAAELGGHGLVVNDMRYWGFSMLPLLALRAVAMRRPPRSAESARRLARQGCEPPSRAAERGLRCLMRLETAIGFRPPVGTSILCACTRV